MQALDNTKQENYSTRPEIGAGITFAIDLMPVIQQYPQYFKGVEIEPQTLFIKQIDGSQQINFPQKVIDTLLSLPGKKLIHSVGAPVGGTKKAEARQIELLKQTIDIFRPPYISEHLSWNATHEFHTAFFLPPRQNQKGIQQAVDNIRFLQDQLNIPIVIETGVNYLKPKSYEIPDGEFLNRIATEANCSILLDLHNVYTNAKNGRQSIFEFVGSLPLDRVWEMHLAGGFEMDGFWLDAHSGSIPDDLVNIAAEVVTYLPNLRSINFEILPVYIQKLGNEGILTEMEKLDAIWQKRDSRPLAKEQKQHSTKITIPDQQENLTWEKGLAHQVTGFSKTTHPEFVGDPGVKLLNKLVQEVRASNVVGIFRLTSRFMMLSLGVEVFREILSDFWSQYPPKGFGSDEAFNFATYLESKNYPLLLLNDLLKMEKTALQTVIDQETRVVRFEHDPFPAINALLNNKLPEMRGKEGIYEIELTGEEEQYADYFSKAIAN